ncbi:EAL domain-containing protein [Rhizobium sp. TH2]|uniref:putative bifunctional diguanylate cyclase/phosphodiesterase n=1 Tax=Rhizobium sp. TH2 TaxID=2775403 RepID=UPI002157586E|nr:EAL domain-containing protein [Rhizobium sp. TH2]UVC11001.1 EAL domain-containing protein [Rhizobium sp. TH2]
MMHARSASLKLISVAWPFVLVIFLQGALAIFSLQVAASLRAYATGESLWSKGQFHALYHLNRYTDSGDPSFLAEYRRSIAVPLGDREGRLALEADPPDVEAAFEGFRKGGNHPDDIPGLIWLFQYFRWVPDMAAAVEDWRAADVGMLKTASFADSIHDTARLSDAERLVLKKRLDAINLEVAPLTRQFSERLGISIRRMQQVLLWSNVGIALIFVILTILRLNAFLAHRRMIEQRLSWNANHDELTRLPNRRLFEQTLGEVMTAPDMTLALMFIDLDQFKAVNDSGGHAAGDRLLQRVSEELLKHTRQDDLLARLGGDEFGLVMPDATEEEARSIASQLREALEALDFTWQGQRYSISASIGLVHFRKGEFTIQEALRAADVACYIAKEKGRNRVHVFESADAAQTQFTVDLGWVQRLHRALEKDSFRLFAQAIAPAKADVTLGEHCEILLRLEEDGKITPPNAFIPAAERFGIMPAIDRWVVRNALDIISRCANPERGTYAINLSGLTFRDDTFLAFLCGELRRTGVPARALCFEVTETAAIQDLDEAVAFMKAARGMGCRFALDDFGVGMSSLTYLKRLPVDFVKIDGSFVRDMLTDRMDRTTVEMINQISHLSGRQTIAELVENEEILAALQEIGVDYVQGYAIARPVPFEPSEGEEERSESRVA